MRAVCSGRDLMEDRQHTMTACIPSRFHTPVLLLCEAAVLALGMALGGSVMEGLYVSAVPAFAVYILLRPAKPRWRDIRGYLVLYVALAGLSAAYMLAWVRTAPWASVRWVELACALYFLGSVHVLLWLADRLLSEGLSRAMRIPAGPAARPAAPGQPALRGRRAARTVLRLLVLVAAGGPFMVSALSMHWIKWGDATDPRQFSGLAYQDAGFYSTDGVRLSAWFIPGQGGMSDSTVILLPARGMGKAGALPYAQAVHASGCNVLVLDPRGEGGSEGHRGGMGVAEAQDVSGAVQYLLQARPRESVAIFAMGVSQGCGAVLKAARADDRIRAVVVDSPLGSPADEIEKMISWAPAPAAAWFEQATLLWASLEQGCNLRGQTACGDVAEISPRPVLMICGREDASAETRQVERLYGAARDPVMLWKAPGAGHAEALASRPAEYSMLVTKMLQSVRIGMSPFGWAR